MSHSGFIPGAYLYILVIRDFLALESKYNRGLHLARELRRGNGLVHLTLEPCHFAHVYT